MGAMHGIAGRYRELGSGAGRGFGVNAVHKANRIHSGNPLREPAESLADDAAEIASRCAALNTRRVDLKRLERLEGQG